MNYHDKSRDEVILALMTDEKNGLSSDEAKKRLEKYGENKLREKKKKSTLARFADQFKDVMILILLLLLLPFIFMILQKKVI